jgi:hypothetical protein
MCETYLNVFVTCLHFRPIETKLELSRQTLEKSPFAMKVRSLGTKLMKKDERMDRRTDESKIYVHFVTWRTC